MTNLLAYLSFTRTDGQSPDGRFTWQDDGARGAFAHAQGVGTIRGSRRAVVGTIVRAKPGDVFAARLRAKTTGRGLAAPSIGWRTADEKWTAHARNVRFIPVLPRPGRIGRTSRGSSKCLREQANSCSWPQPAD